MTLEHDSLRDLRAAPELAHVTVLIVAADALERALQLAHGPLDHQPPPHGPRSLIWAADLLVRLRALRHALRRYRAVVRRPLRPLRPRDDDLF